MRKFESSEEVSVPVSPYISNGPEFLRFYKKASLVRRAIWFLKKVFGRLPRSGILVRGGDGKDYVFLVGSPGEKDQQ